MTRLQLEFEPEVAAHALSMDNEQLRAYYELMLIGGIHYWTARNLIENTPHEYLRECVRQLTVAAA